MLAVRVIVVLLLCIALPSLRARAQDGRDQSPTVSTTRQIERIEAIANNFRKIVVLTREYEKLDERSRRKIDGLTWILEQENQGRLTDLLMTMTDHSGRPSLANIQVLLDELEYSRKYSSCDRLAFAKVLERTFELRKQLPPELRSRLQSEMAILRRIQPFDPAAARTGSHSEAFLTSEWSDYVELLKRAYPKDTLLKEYASILPAK